jgi:hypothetical protein
MHRINPWEWGLLLLPLAHPIHRSNLHAALRIQHVSCLVLKIPSHQALISSHPHTAVFILHKTVASEHNKEFVEQENKHM